MGAHMCNIQTFDLIESIVQSAGQGGGHLSEPAAMTTKIGEEEGGVIRLSVGTISWSPPCQQVP